MNKAVFYKISYGLYIIFPGRMANSTARLAIVCFQVTSDPATIAISIN